MFIENIVVGKCSICSGKVCIRFGHPASCVSCGAVEDVDLPVVKMKHKKPTMQEEYMKRLNERKCWCLNGCKSAECDKL
jgi:hypothetical protein